MTVPSRQQPPTDASAKSLDTGRHAAEPSIGELVGEVSTHLSTLVRSEVELAKLELRSSVKNAGVGVGSFIAAAVLLVFALIYGFFAVAEAIATVLPRWAAFLIVFGALALIAGLLVVFGLTRVKKVRAPQQTITTGKQTVAYLRDHG